MNRHQIRVSDSYVQLRDGSRHLDEEERKGLEIRSRTYRDRSVREARYSAGTGSGAGTVTSWRPHLSSVVVAKRGLALILRRLLL